MPDRGIYHAWNKALKYAQGEWICFLGADDYFWDKHVLSNIAFHLKRARAEKINLVYGQIARVNNKGHIVKLAGKQWHKIKWQMPHGMPLDLPHPGLMHHHSIFKKHGVFDESFKIAGDYDLLLRELKSGKALFAKNIRTVACQIGGIADSSNMLSHMEVKRARAKNGYKHFSYPIQIPG
ncbi:MAG: glycosyltransferase [Thermodesulfobacteriota bacterium]|nr:glycosyltransferase [Thermodesulfobacteriota bacterium]